MARAAQWVRLCAIAAMLHFRGDAVAAAPLFEIYCPDHGLKEDLGEFCRRWWQRYLETKDGGCVLGEAHRSGRPVQLKQKAINRAAKAFAQGWYSNGKKKAFTSLEQVTSTWCPAPLPPPSLPTPQCTPLGCCCSKPWLAHSPCVQALDKSPVLRGILEASNTTPEYLWRQAKQADPRLQFKWTTVKPAFTEEEKLQRINFCLAMLSEPPEWLRGIVWMDESSVPFTIKPIRVIGRRGKEALQTDSRIARDKRKIPYIHYMLSVCWATGLVRMDILSFSAGAHDPVQYYVSVGCRCPAACTPTSSLGHLVFLCVAARVEP
jgi:hypothetical protein